MKILFKEYKQPLRLRFKGVVTSGGGGAVDSVNGRTGVVSAQNGDYTASQVTNVPAGSVTATDVQTAITELDTNKASKASPAFTGTMSTQHIAPASTATYNIGSSSFRYSNVHSGTFTPYNATAIAMPEGGNIVLGTTTGTKIGTSTSQKLAFFNATPVVQQAGSVISALAALGLVASPTISKSDVGLPNVDNTSDANKPVSTATQTALNAKLDASAYDDATQAETDAASSTAKYVSPAGLKTSKAGSKAVSVYAVEASTTLATGDGKAYFRIPTTLNGMNLVMCGIAVIAPSSSGLPTVQIARGRQASPTSAHTFADMLSTKLTIDVSEYDSSTATTPVVIDTANDDVLTGDLIRVDVDVAGTGVTGLIVTMTFQLP